MPDRPMKRALISVYNKQGIVAFAEELHHLGIELLSTGGTFRLLKENNLPVTEVSEYTGFPEIMGGRVKTLHPKVHGGILGRPGVDDTVMTEHGIQPIDMVIVNLYPFEETISQENCSLTEAIEQIDIGGPTMIRAAAKNNQFVTVVCDPDDYQSLAMALRDNDNQLSATTRLKLAQKAFQHTASYDVAIANYLADETNTASADSDYPQNLVLQFDKVADLRYGENPHQTAAMYKEKTSTEPCITNSEQLQGKALSYNNIADADAALECVKNFNETAGCVIVKHANPCGVALGTSTLDCYDKAYATDPTSAFGGIIAFNQKVDLSTVQEILNRQFVEVIIAPDYDTEAIAELTSKPNIRVLKTGDWPTNPLPDQEYKRIKGGLLVQTTDNLRLDTSTLTTVTKRQPDAQEFADLCFAWQVAQYVKSNAIVYAKNEQTIGIGAGQMSRLYSAKIAGIKARDEGLTVEGSVMASDAFFPFRDTIDTAAKDGITAIIQPGGSIRDEEVIAAADEQNIAMVLTGIRHFKH